MFKERGRRRLEEGKQENLLASLQGKEKVCVSQTDRASSFDHRIRFLSPLFSSSFDEEAFIDHCLQGREKEEEVEWCQSGERQ